jgi:hypothetical protein
MDFPPCNFISLTLHPFIPSTHSIYQMDIFHPLFIFSKPILPSSFPPSSPHPNTSPIIVLPQFTPLSEGVVGMGCEHQSIPSSGPPSNKFPHLFYGICPFRPPFRCKYSADLLIFLPFSPPLPSCALLRSPPPLLLPFFPPFH